MNHPIVPPTNTTPDAGEHRPPLAGALPIITRMAHWYWLAAKQRVPLEDLLGLGVAVLRKQLAIQDNASSTPAGCYGPAQLSPLLHQAMRMYMMRHSALIRSPGSN